MLEFWSSSDSEHVDNQVSDNNTDDNKYRTDNIEGCGSESRLHGNEITCLRDTDGHKICDYNIRDDVKDHSFKVDVCDIDNRSVIDFSDKCRIDNNKRYYKYQREKIEICNMGNSVSVICYHTERDNTSLNDNSVIKTEDIEEKIKKEAVFKMLEDVVVVDNTSDDIIDNGNCKIDNREVFEDAVIFVQSVDNDKDNTAIDNICTVENRDDDGRELWHDRKEEENIDANISNEEAKESEEKTISIQKTYNGDSIINENNDDENDDSIINENNDDENDDNIINENNDDKNDNSIINENNNDENDDSIINENNDDENDDSIINENNEVESDNNLIYNITCAIINECSSHECNGESNPNTQVFTDDVAVDNTSSSDENSLQCDESGKDETDNDSSKDSEECDPFYGICHYKAKCLRGNLDTMNRKEKVKVDESEPTWSEEAPFERRNVVIKKDRWVTDMYSVDSVLGRGKFGEVKQCRERRTGRQLAAKFIEVNGPQDRTDVINELEIMKHLQHPRLLQLYDAFENRDKFCLVLELVSGGELFERVINDDFILTEKACVMFTRQICDGVAFMHSESILHLDMKPENILCLTREGNRIKIIDFGLARKYNPKDDLRVLFGTPEFVAPEVVNFDPISPPTDMWSVGVICYVLLSGLSPFMGETEPETLSNVTMARWDFNAEEFENISAEAKDFISKLLVKNPRHRMTASDCLEHQWLRRSVKRENHVPERSLSKKRLRKFVYRRKWQKAINAMLALRRMGVALC